MARSLKVHLNYLEKVKSSLQRNRYPSQKALAVDVGLSLSTVKNFLSGQPVDYINFCEICEKLGLDWQEVADKTDTVVPVQLSPFITGAPVTQPSRFFGRERELKRLFNLIKKHPLQNAAIIGKRRIGKTSLLHYLKNITATGVEQLRKGQKSDWLPNPKNYKWIFVDFQDHRMATRKKLMSYILECMDLKYPENCSLCDFMNIVSDNLRNPTVILLDEIGVGLQRCPELDDEFWESLRSLTTNQTQGNLGFILATHSSPTELARSTGHSSPFFNIFGYTATLDALTEDEACELIASSPIPFAEEDVNWILEQSRHLPLLLQILCSERLFALEECDDDYNWQEEGLKQIQNFADL